jgi:hypothetical protein
VLNAVTVTKNTTFMITDHHLRIGSQIQIRIKAANANQISAVAVTLEQMPQQNAQGGVVGPGIA